MTNFTQNEKGQMYYEGSLKFTAKDGSVFFVSMEELTCKAYRAKAKKPFMNYWYKSAEAMKKAVETAINSCNQRHELKMTQKQKEKDRLNEFRKSLKVGDILSTCWGYEQTNVEFYQVVAVKGAYCEVREVAKRTHSTAFMQSEVSPKPNEFIGEVKRRKILDQCIKITSYIRATPHGFKILPTGTKVYDTASTSSYA